jgi:hypothetical protein
VKLILCIAVMLRRSPAASRCQNRVLAISPLVCQAHEMVNRLRLAAPELLLEVSSNETVPKGIDCSFGRDIFRRIVETDPS